MRALLTNSRFYILAVAFISSVMIASVARIFLSSDQLFYIRIEQIYGFVAAMLLYFALILSPLSKLVSKTGSIKYMLFARRAIGVSAAYFALLHAGVAVFGQIGGFSRLSLLPDIFKLSISFGAVALFVLFIMAVTSTDKAISFLTFRRWKWIHRFVYASGVLIILHVWLIGTHLGYLSFQAVSFTALVILFGLESMRISNVLAKKYEKFNKKKQLFAVAITLCLTFLLLAMPRFVTSFRDEHTEHNVEHGDSHGATHE